MRILILGGTAEARELADRLDAAGHETITSLAGRTEAPLRPRGALRVGKFGGVPGLIGYLRAHRIERLVDATHPYTGLMSVNAVAGAAATGVPLVRLMRPAWPDEPGWVQVDTIAEAAAAPPPASHVLVTTGHEGLQKILARDDCDFVVRLIEEPDFALPRHARLLLARPPYALLGETALMQRERVTHLITKNSGGPQTRAKLDAAKALGVTVIVLRRPVYPPAPEVGSVGEAIAALQLDAS